MTTTTTRPSYPPQPCEWEALPFINHSGKKSTRGNWKVEPTDDYALACNKGAEYAAHMACYLLQNPSWVGSNMLGHIAGHIDFADDSETKGYWVGFFSHLEYMLYYFSKEHDPWDFHLQINRHFEQLRKDREQQVAE